MGSECHLKRYFAEHSVASMSKFPKRSEQSYLLSYIYHFAGSVVDAQVSHRVRHLCMTSYIRKRTIILQPKFSGTWSSRKICETFATYSMQALSQMNVTLLYTICCVWNCIALCCTHALESQRGTYIHILQLSQLLKQTQMNWTLHCSTR